MALTRSIYFVDRNGTERDAFVKSTGQSRGRVPECFALAWIASERPPLYQRATDRLVRRVLVKVNGVFYTRQHTE